MAASLLKQTLQLLYAAAAPGYKPHARRVCLMIGGLRPGGAERQMCNLALGLKQAGWQPTVLVYETGKAETPHYRAFLRDHGIAYRMIVPPAAGQAEALLQALKGLSDAERQLLLRLPAPYVVRTARLIETLRKLRPELLVSYLDWQNTISGLAAAIAGLSHVLLVGRNFGPHHFPHLYKKSAIPDFRRIYKAVSTLPFIRFANNSMGGAADYASWLGLPSARVAVVPNCVTEDFSVKPSASRVQAVRKFLELKRGQPLILGVFRVTEEKRPEDFLRVIVALRKRYPTLRGVLCGQLISQETQVWIDRRGLKEVITLTGVMEDIPALMAAATILLHPAAIEGSPNAILEAQAIGLPVVCANNAGVRMVLAPEWVPFMRKVGDVKGLATSCAALLDGPNECQKRAKGARRYTLQTFSLERLVQGTLGAVV